MSPQLHQSYAALHEHVDRQYQHLTKTMGISHEIVGEDPYASPRDLRADVSKNKRIRTLASDATGATAADDRCTERQVPGRPRRLRPPRHRS